MQVFTYHLKGDRGIWLIIALLTLISVLAVYTSTSGLAFQQREGSTEYYLLKHVALMALGLLMMFLVHRIDYRAFARFANLLLAISALLLFYTLFQGQAAEVNEARRWIRVFGLSFQPSDLAKFSLMIYLAKVLTQRQNLIKDFRRSFVPTILPVFVICGLIAPHNLSTAMVLMFTSFILMFIAGINSRHMLGLMLSGLLLATVAIYGNIFKRSATWQHRIENWWAGQPNNDEQFQREQANMAIATSGFLGKGAGKSVQRHYLPQAYSDFVYAIIIEEYGLLGGVVVLALYILLMI
ncbi:MAG: FtsW/RodA/SpoVE family cell cycle protein, partial [Sphingobacteriia bacterium]